VYVTGKGGSGKTTISGALGLAAAALGRRTIVCDLAGGHNLARAFDLGHDDAGEVSLTDDPSSRTRRTRHPSGLPFACQ